MNTFLYQVPKLRVFGIEAGKPARYDHTFGGPPQHEGVVPKGGTHALHLLYSLNTDDPGVGIKIPGVRRLPLYHGFVYDHCGLGYRVVSDTEIQILHLESLSVPDAFPHEDYPVAFRKASVQICKTHFNHKDTEHAIAFAGVFGFDWVPKRERPKMHKILAEKYPNYSIDDDEPPESFEELAKAFESPFMQGRPDSKCPNRKCPNHKHHGRMQVLATVDNKPVPRVSLWGKWGEGVQLIFEICPKCRSIYTSNQCT